MYENVIFFLGRPRFNRGLTRVCHILRLGFLVKTRVCHSAALPAFSLFFLPSPANTRVYTRFVSSAESTGERVSIV